MAYHLYWLSGVPSVWRVMLALNLKKIRYTETRFEPGSEEMSDPSFLQINPRGQVPVLMTPDGPVRESLAILAYLDRVKPEPPLFGRSATETGVIWQWIMDYENHLRDAMVTLATIAFTGEQKTRAADLAGAMQIGVREFATILHRLRLMPWLGGNKISAADIVLYPGIQWMRRSLDHLEPSELHDMMQNPALKKWEQKIERLPKFDRTVPPGWSTDAPMNIVGLA